MMLWEAVAGPMGWPWIPSLKFAGFAAVQGLLAPVFAAMFGLCLRASGWCNLCLKVNVVISLGADAQQ
jgi:hypothetical protein